MKMAVGAALGLLACVSLAGCDMLKKDKEPTGQVVATVDGEEITLTAVRAELGNQMPKDPKARKEAEMAALQRILARKVLAKAAQKADVEKSPQYAIQKERLEEGLLVQAYQTQVAEAVPIPSREEATRFINEHPHTYAQRKIYVVDQIRMGRPNDPTLLNQLQPLDTLEEVASVLQANGMQFQRVAGKIDAVAIEPSMMDQIAKLPPTEMFVIPAGQGLVVNAIRETQVVPFTGEPAVKHATAVLRSQRAQETVRKQFGNVLGQAVASVKYNKAYAPPKPPAKAAPAKPASGQTTPAGAAPAAPTAQAG